MADREEKKGIVYNANYGGFSVSENTAEILGMDSVYDDVDRSDPRLVRMVETGEEKNRDLRVEYVDRKYVDTGA